MKLYTIYDVKEQKHTQPFTFENHDVAARVVADQVRTDKIPFAEDKELHYFGEMCDKSLKFDTTGQKMLVKLSRYKE